VIIENGRAIGVQTVTSKPLSPSEQKPSIFKARNFVIVSGGSLSSPQILQRSGVGDAQKLRKVGVKPLVDLPGVGLNYQDHSLFTSTYRATPESETFDDFARGDPAIQKAVFEEWNIRGTGPLATNGFEAGVKIRPTKEELEEMKNWPTNQFAKGGWDYFKDKPDKPVLHFSVVSG
jgi:alcohol oxidase